MKKNELWDMCDERGLLDGREYDTTTVKELNAMLSEQTEPVDETRELPTDSLCETCANRACAGLMQMMATSATRAQGCAKYVPQ